MENSSLRATRRLSISVYILGSEFGEEGATNILKRLNATVSGKREAMIRKIDDPYNLSLKWCYDLN